jgi:hypothetical protein
MKPYRAGSIRVIAQYVDGAVASNAKVCVDGQLKGYTDDRGVLLVSVPSGSHTVMVWQDVPGIADKYVSDDVSVDVPARASVDAKVTLKCSGDCVKISASASPSTARPGDSITVTVKYVFFHCCSGCCSVKANAFGDWAKTTQLAVIHDGCEGQFHTEITKNFTFTLPTSISAGTHYVRVGFNYDYSFKTSYDDLSTTTHVDVPVSVQALAETPPTPPPQQSSPPSPETPPPQGALPPTLYAAILTAVFCTAIALALYRWGKVASRRASVREGRTVVKGGEGGARLTKVGETEVVDPSRIKEYLERLEELYREGKVSEYAYRKLKEEYEEKLRKMR